MDETHESESHLVLSGIEEMLGRINDAVEEIERADQKARSLHVELQQKILSLAKISDRSERLRIIRHLYWNEPRANVKALSAALLIEWDDANDQPKHGPVDLEKFVRYGDQLRRMVGPVMVSCATSDCSGLAAVTSRTKLNWKYSFEYCEDCVNRKALENAEYWAKRERNLQALREKEVAWRAELEGLKSNSTMGESELMRFYELMSYFDRRQ